MKPMDLVPGPTRGWSLFPGTTTTVWNMKMLAQTALEVTEMDGAHPHPPAIGTTTTTMDGGTTTGTMKTMDGGTTTTVWNMKMLAQTALEVTEMDGAHPHPPATGMTTTTMDGGTTTGTMNMDGGTTTTVWIMKMLAQTALEVTEMDGAQPHPPAIGTTTTTMDGGTTTTTMKVDGGTTTTTMKVDGGT